MSRLHRDLLPFFANLWGRFRSECRGNFATIFAIGLPAIALGALGAVDISSVINDRAKIQAVADFAALSAAKQLAIDASANTATRAKLHAESELADVAKRWSFNITAKITQKGKAVEVNIYGHRASYFHDLLPKGGWKAHGAATAVIEGQTPLCVLGAGKNTGGLLGLGLLATPNVITLKNTARLTAEDCMIQSNNAIKAANTSSVEAAFVQSVGEASGTINPEAMTGAAEIEDPFANLNVAVPTLCTDLNVALPLGSKVTLKPGVHCGVITALGNSEIELAPGEHYFFAGILSLGNNTKLTGKDVVLIFDALSFFAFTEHSEIELEGRQSGPFAGFVIATTKTNTKTFNISTTAARKLLGVVYIPNGLLSVTGDSSVAENSAWTVIVAKTLSISGGANLVVNANYTAQGAAPVPMGVGPNAANSNVRLID